MRTASFQYMWRELWPLTLLQMLQEVLDVRSPSSSIATGRLIAIIRPATAPPSIRRHDSSPRVLARSLLFASATRDEEEATRRGRRSLVLRLGMMVVLGADSSVSEAALRGEARDAINTWPRRASQLTSHGKPGASERKPP